MLAPLAAVGLVMLVRRRVSVGLIVLGAPLVLVLLVAVATYGSTRFRFAAEPSVVVLGALTLDALLARRPSRRLRSTSR